MLRVSKLSYRVGDAELLKDISFDWASGLLVILGANGAGKSTLLKCLATAIVPKTKCISWHGRPIATDIGAFRRVLGYAPQEHRVESRLTAREFLEICSALRQLRAKNRSAEAFAALTLMGLDNFADLPLVNLSGGSLKKLIVAQALLGSPEIVLLDEPTSEVDIAASQAIWTRLAHYAAARPVIISSHDVAPAYNAAQGLCFMEKGALSPIYSPREISLPEVQTRIGCP